MKVLLVQHSKENTRFYPAGLGYVAAALREEGHDVRFLELAFEDDPVAALDNKIRRFDPQALGLTLWTSQYPQFARLMNESKLARGLTVVAGGPHASAAAEDVIADGLVDVVVRGEGEVIAPALFSALADGGNLAAVQGIAFRDAEGHFVQTPEVGRAADLKAMPWPAYDLFDLRRYYNPIHGRNSMSVMTSRGCPHKCVFCYRGPTGGRKVRFIDVEEVFQELCRLQDQFGYQAFYFSDDIFTLNPHRIRVLCERIIASGRRIYWVCQTRADCVDRDLLVCMKKSGCVAVYFGVESGSQHILDKLNKRLSLADIRQAFACCRELRIATVATFILGLPWETPETIRQSMDLAKEIKPTVSAFLVATPYPGTRLRELFLERGMFVPQDHRDYRQFVEGDVGGGGSRELDEVGRNCIAATREVVMAQIKDVLSYPRLLTELVNLYGFRSLVRRAWRRIWSVLLRPRG